MAATIAIIEPDQGLALSVGNRVEATANLNIRKSASLSGEVLGIAASGSLGTILSGPSSAGGYTWWYIDWDSYPTGWSVSTYLTAATSPAGPSGLAAYATESLVSLAWYDNSSNESGFKVERKTGSGGTWSQIATPGQNVAAYQDYNITPGTTYYYRVRAYNAEGNSSYSNEVSATPTVSPPAAPTHLETCAYSDRVETGWTDNSFNETGFKVERRIGAGSWSQIAIVSGGSGEGKLYTDNSSTPHTTYSYRVRAYNAAGNSAYTDEVTLTTPAGRPGSFTLSNEPPYWDTSRSPAGPSVRLNWTASADVGAYAVYRDGSVYRAGLTDRTFLNEANLTPGVTYTYFIRASNAEGTTDSTTVVVTMPNGPSGGPPGAFTLSNEPPCWDSSPPAGPAVRLNWTASSSASGYALYRDGSLYRSGISGTTFRNEVNLTAGATYTYFIRASNANGTRDSNTISVTMPEGPSVASLQIGTPNGGETFDAGASNEITWNLTFVPDGLSYFRIFFSSDGGSTFSVIRSSVASGARSYDWSIPTSTQTTRGRIRVEGRDSQGLVLAAGTSASNFTIDPPAGGPTAAIDGSSASQSGQQVTFSGAGSTPAAEIVSYEWDFGDGQTASGINPTHAFSAVGQQNFTVSLTVTDGLGRSDVESATITVTGRAVGLDTESSYSRDPVNLATGNYVYSHTDLAYPGRGFGFQFTRTYNSQDSQFAPGPLGHRWTHSYNVRLFDGPAGEKIVLLGDGRKETYFPDEFGGYYSEPGVHNELLVAGDGTLGLATRSRHFFVFAADGRLDFIMDRNQNALTLAYTAEGWLDAITDTAGRTVDFENDAAGRITRITDPGGRVIRFEYDARGDMTEAFDARDHPIQYVYDSDHQITSARDPNGNEFVRNTYDATHRVVTAQQDALGNETRFQYDPVTRITTVTDPLGNRTIHRHDERLRASSVTDALGNTESYEYDADDNRTRVTDRKGHVTEYEYDDSGNMTFRRDPIGAETYLGYTWFNDLDWKEDPEGTTTWYTYDGHGNLVETEVDGFGVRSSFERDSFGQPTAMLDGASNRTERAYDTNGNCIVVRDPMGGETWMAYDSVGRRIAETNAVGMVTTFAHDPADNLVTLVEPGGATRGYAYDANGNRIMEIDPIGRTNSFVFDAKDRLIGTTNALGGVTRYTYDALDRRTAVTDPGGASTSMEYDAVGNLIRITDSTGRATAFAYDANGNRTSETNAAGEVFCHTYDAANRLLSTIDPLNQQTSTAYDFLGRQTAKTDALGRSTFFTYDILGRLTNVTDPAGGTVAYEYDAADRRTRVVDPNGSGTVCEYDAASRMIRKTEPSIQSYFFTYDAASRLTSRTDPNGTTISNVYAASGRLAEVRYPSGAVNFEYDLAGRRTTMIDTTGTNTWAHDAGDHVIAREDGFGHTVTYDYDATGHRTRLTYPGSNTVTYSYDPAGRMTGFTDWTGAQTRYSYDAAGRLVKAINPNSTRTTYRYDKAGCLIGLTNSAPLGSVISCYLLTLDAVGNPKQIDKQEPVEAPTISTNVTYTYDADNRLMSANGTLFSYDANGNTTAIGSDLFAYDPEDRLIESVVAGSTNSYRYDGLGHRVAKVEAGATTRYVLDTASSLSQILMETDASGAPRAYYIYGLGLSARIGADGSRQVYHYDTRANTVAMTDDAGTIVHQAAFDDFGQRLEMAGQTENPFGFSGRYAVATDAAGFVFLRARVYNPTLGRFLTKDPFPPQTGESQRLHRYVYCLNNPVRFVDPSGWDAQETAKAQDVSIVQTQEALTKEEKRARLARSIRMSQSQIESLSYEIDSIFENAKADILQAELDAIWSSVTLWTGGTVSTLTSIARQGTGIVSVNLGKRDLGNGIRLGIDLFDAAHGVYNAIGASKELYHLSGIMPIRAANPNVIRTMWTDGISGLMTSGDTKFAETISGWVQDVLMNIGGGESSPRGPW